MTFLLVLGFSARSCLSIGKGSCRLSNSVAYKLAVPALADECAELPVRIGGDEIERSLFRCEPDHGKRQDPSGRPVFPGRAEFVVFLHIFYVQPLEDLFQSR